MYSNKKTGITISRARVSEQGKEEHTEDDELRRGEVKDESKRQ